MTLELDFQVKNLEDERAPLADETYQCIGQIFILTLVETII